VKFLLVPGFDAAPDTAAAPAFPLGAGTAPDGTVSAKATANADRSTNTALFNTMDLHPFDTDQESPIPRGHENLAGGS
jgi:hypothetical protein